MVAGLRAFAALVVAVALLAMGAAVPALSQDDDDERETLRLRSYNKKETNRQVDVRENGEGPGDYEVGSGPLFRAGEKAGNQRHVCTNLPSGQDRFTAHCVGTFVVKDRGTLEVAGTLTFARRGLAESNLAIVGGTGQFREADGALKLNEHKSSIVFEFHIIT